MSNDRSMTVVFTIACGLASSLPARAQCSEWKAGFHPPGTDDFVSCFAVYDDGSGPALYAGGTFTLAGDAHANRVAKWDGTHWSELGSGMDESVLALATFDDGSGPALYAGGHFTTAGGVPASYIARWDGAHWSALGTGTDSFVTSLTVFDDGAGAALYAGGSFTTAGGVAANHVAKWNGASWSALGTGTNDSVWSLAVFDAASGPALYVGGSFTKAGGNGANHIAKWNGASWSSVGTGLDNVPQAMIAHDDGSGSVLYVGGQFTTAGSVAAAHIGKWNGSAWSAVGGGVGSAVWTLAAFDDGSGSALYAGGPFTFAGGASASSIAKWNGTSWSPLDSGTSGAVAGLTAFDDGSGPALYAGGAFAIIGGRAASHVAKWSGTTWQRVSDGDGVSANVNTFAVFDDGSGPRLYAGGAFLAAGDVVANRVAEWDGHGWEALGGGVAGGIAFGMFSTFVRTLTVFDDGSGSALYAGGSFMTAGGMSAKNIAKWDGANWSALGSGLNTSVEASCVFDDGTGPALYVGGEFTIAGGVTVDHVARWDGTTWSPLASAPGGMRPEAVAAMTVFDDGSGAALYASGTFADLAGTSTAYIAKWNGAGWSALGTGVVGEIYALCVFDDGTGPALYAGGSLMAPVRSIAKWNGVNWSDVGSGFGGSYVYAMTVHDDGSGPALFAGGDFATAGGTSANRIAKWNGASWSALGSGASGALIAALGVYDDGADGAPDLYVGGEFRQAGGVSGPYIAEWLGCEPGEAYCFGDGLDTAVTALCPCGNLGAAGHGCGNSNPALQGARLDASGSVNPNTIVLACSGVPNGNLCVFQSSANSTGAGITFGDGIRCVIGAALPFGQQVAGRRGNASHTVQSSASTEPNGATRHYQVLYRNPSPAACAPALFNLSNAYSIAW